MEEGNRWRRRERERERERERGAITGVASLLKGGHLLPPP